MDTSNVQVKQEVQEPETIVAPVEEQPVANEGGDTLPETTAEVEETKVTAGGDEPVEEAAQAEQNVSVEKMEGVVESSEPVAQPAEEAAREQSATEQSTQDVSVKDVVMDETPAVEATNVENPPETESNVEQEVPMEESVAVPEETPAPVAAAEPEVSINTEAVPETPASETSVSNVEPVTPAVPEPAPADVSVTEKQAEPAAPTTPAAKPLTQISTPQTTVSPKQDAQATSILSASTKRPKIDLSSLSTRDYLGQTIVPILFECLSSLARTRPEDPIQYMANYLLENRNKFEANAAAAVNGSNLLGKKA